MILFDLVVQMSYMAFQIDEPCQPCQPIEVVLLALFKFWSNQVLGNAKNQVLCCWELIVQTVIFYFFSGVCLDGWYPYFSFRNYAPSLEVLVKQHDHFCIIVVDLMDGIHWHTLIVFVCLFFSFFFLIEKAHTTFPFIFFIGKPNTQTNPDCWNKPWPNTFFSSQIHLHLNLLLIPIHFFFPYILTASTLNPMSNKR